MPGAHLPKSLTHTLRAALLTGAAALIVPFGPAFGPLPAGAEDLVVETGSTLINDSREYADTFVAPNSGNNASLVVTTYGTLSNTDTLSVATSGTGSLAVTGGSLTSNYGYLGHNVGSVGTATVSSGTWNTTAELHVGYEGSGALGVTGGSLVSDDGYVGYGVGSVGAATVSSGTWDTSGNLTVGVSGAGTLTMDGGVVSVGGTLSRGASGTINLNAGGTLRIGSGGTRGDLGVASLTANGTLIFSRSDESTYSGALSGSGAVVKQGVGTLTLSGVSTYSGPTTVQAGTLALSGTLSSSAVTVNAGAVLSGNGFIGSSLTVQSSGTLAPGNSPGQNTTGTLSLQAGSTTVMEIVGSTAAGTDYDTVVVTGTNGLTYGGALSIVFSDTNPFADDTTFDLFNYAGSSSGTFASITTGGSGVYAGLSFIATPDGFWYSGHTIGGQYLRFNPTSGDLVVVPEPSTWGLVVSGIAFAAALARRRRRWRTGGGIVDRVETLA